MTVYMVTWSMPGRDNPITRWTHDITVFEDRGELGFESVVSGEVYHVGMSCAYYVVSKSELPPKVAAEAESGAVEVNHGP